jgi:hypothetical protein
VPSDDVDALTAALRQKLEAKETLNLRARQRILKNFTVPHFGDMTEQALIRALQRSRKRPRPSLSRTVDA